jgi:HEAT repeat protein
MPLLTKSERPAKAAPKRRPASLDDDAPEQRALALRGMACPDAVDTLGRHLAREQDRGVRDAIFATLVQIGTTEALTQILWHLHAEDLGLRNAAVSAAQHLPDQMEPAIARLLCDPDPDLRLYGVRILEELPHPQVVEWLTAVLWHETHANVIGAALDIMAECGEARLLPALDDIRDRFPDEGYLHFACDFVARRIGAAP